MTSTPVSVTPVPQMPNRIQCALQYLNLLVSIEFPYVDSSVRKDRELSEDELLVKKSALKCLNLYFLGESDFGDYPINSSSTESAKTEKVESVEAKND